MKKFLKKFAVMSVTFSFAFNFAIAQTLEEAIKHLDAERYSAASKAFNQLAETSPSPQTLFYKGYAQLKTPDGLSSENLKNAQEAFEKGNALEKKGDPINQVGLGMVKLASNDVAGAKAIFEEVKKSTKLKNLDALYRIAEAYTMFPATADAAEAITNIDMALEKSKVKNNPEYYIVKSDAFMIKNEGGDAMNALQNAERLGKSLAKIYEKMARVWLQGKNYKEAEEAINKGIAADPTHAPIYRYQSSYHQSRNNYPAAAQAAMKYLENSDGDCKAKVRSMKLLFIAKDFANAKKLINETQECNDDPYIDRIMGIINFEENKPEDAIGYMRKFIKRIPKDEENPGLDYGYIGRSYFIKPGEGEERDLNDSLAVINIEKAVELGDTTYNYYQEVGSTFVKRRKYDKAAYYFEKNLKRKKNPDASDFATVGSYYNASRKYEKADEYVDKALELYKDLWVDGYYTSAYIKTQRYISDSTYSANYSAAPIYEKYLEKLGDAGQNDAKNKAKVINSLFYLVGKEYQVTKDLVKAKVYLQKILAIDPTNERALEQVKVMEQVENSEIKKI
jgi:tetratricopeptide (TPR) repeat protein